MLCARCVLPLLALYMLLDEMSAAVLPSSLRNKREANWLDRDLFSRLPDQPDLSVGDAGDLIRHVDHRPLLSDGPLAPTERLSSKSQRKANEKRRKVAPLDSLGSFQMSNTRSRKDEPNIYWGDAND